MLKPRPTQDQLETCYPYRRIVKLQKGHKYPRGQENNSNFIPQCADCNRSYKDDFTFDDNGRVRAVNSLNPVSRARKDVQIEILSALLKKYPDNV